MIKNFLIFLVFLLIGIIAIISFYKLAPPGVVTSLEILPKTQFSMDNAPTDSLVGEISSISGAVSYEPRSANAGFIINSPTKIQQGDQISTLGNGSSIISFPKIGEISMSPKTDISIIQSLPQNFVVLESGGKASFQRTGDIPFSVRSLDLIINLDQNTNVSISVDKDNSRIQFIVNSGEVTFAYTDTENKSNVIKAKPGKEIIFDNNTKAFSVNFL